MRGFGGGTLRPRRGGRLVLGLALLPRRQQCSCPLRRRRRRLRVVVHGMRRIVDPRAVGAVSQRGVMRMPRVVGELSEAEGVV